MIDSNDLREATEKRKAKRANMYFRMACSAILGLIALYLFFSDSPNAQYWFGFAILGYFVYPHD